MATTRTVTGSRYVVRVSVERIDMVVIKDEYDRTATASLVPMEESIEELQIKAEQSSVGAAVALAIATLKLRDPGEPAS